MKRIFLFLNFASLLWSAGQAANVTITRDDWGIAHIHGKTDADAVFGMIYAQAEDDFKRVETNYLNALGRVAEAEGEQAITKDLRMKMFVDPTELKQLYGQSPPWLRKLMNAFADGLNFYLDTHPAIQPRVIRHFEPWMALSFTEGSIGGDIETAVKLGALKQFEEGEPGGSNGIAIAPSNTVNHHALLLINPHTTFFFRSELQMTSDEGLNAYGAVTWGQFFIYQGFNEHAGWMHTSSGVDAIDEYVESVTKKGERYFYKYGSEERPVLSKIIEVPYRTPQGMRTRRFTVYRTHHGPIIRQDGGKWIAVRLMQKPIEALTQSYIRTKAHDYKSFKQTMELKANSSNNTVFADDSGNIAYFHGNFIPRRDTRFDWTKPVDGADPATEWKGLLDVDEAPNLLNPKIGWLYNSNNWPWSAAGPDSLKKDNYPAYVDKGREETPRGLHAIRVLTGKHNFTLDSLIAAAYDTYLPWFDTSLPPLFTAWEQLPPNDPLRTGLAEQIDVLRKWNRRWSVDSIPTALGAFWFEELQKNKTDPLKALDAASRKLTADFGTWRTRWGEINRFQRLTGDIVQPFNDAAPSLPVGFTSGLLGSLAAFNAQRYPGTKKWYGFKGNSFVAVVEFGTKVRARAFSTGGESGDPKSPHFNDQALRYTTGRLREVYFYPEQRKGHTSRTYHPGQ
jgi:acyl-homoserine-lactone acylase